MMKMRITITMAKNAATKMANEKCKPAIKRAQELLKYCVIETVKAIPCELIEVCNDYPDYVYCTNEVYMWWNGNRYYVTLPFNIPSAIMSLDRNVYAKESRDKIIEACKGVLKAELKRDELINTLETAIFSLRTKARLEEEFPEASKYIDWPTDKYVPMVHLPIEIRKMFEK